MLPFTCSPTRWAHQRGTVAEAIRPASSTTTSAIPTHIARRPQFDDSASAGILASARGYATGGDILRRMTPIGRGSPAVTGISDVHPHRVVVRGLDLTGDVMGRLTFTEYFHLLLTGSEPSEEQRFFLDLLLVSIAEHGMMPSNVAARMTLAAGPDALQGAVAAGILGAGPVVLGTSGECAALLAAAQSRVAEGAEPSAVARDVAHSVREAGGKMPGFGHPVHAPVDPRAERILELADERGVSGPHVALARLLRDAVADAWGKDLPLNVAMPIAAVMLDLGYPAASVKAVPILARTAGLLAHLAEEQEQPIGFLLAGAAEVAVEYEPPPA
jgi:citrate synthase